MVAKAYFYWVMAEGFNSLSLKARAAEKPKIACVSLSAGGHFVFAGCHLPGKGVNMRERQ